MKTNKKIAIFGLVALSLIGFSFVNKSENSVNNTESSAQMATLNVGDKAPELAYTNPDGKIMKLSDLKGKVVLIDFWASWCRPCRVENPNLVQLYRSNKERGLSIVGVSLDRDKNKWIKAIEDDGLVWDHVSHLQFWNDPIAKLYKVSAIPATFVLDENGVIIARDLRGMELYTKVEELLSKS